MYFIVNCTNDWLLFLAADSIKFEKLIYHGEYNKQTQKLEVTETITLQTNVDAQKIKATIEDGMYIDIYSM